MKYENATKRLFKSKQMQYTYDDITNTINSVCQLIESVFEILFSTTKKRAVSFDRYTDYWQNSNRIIADNNNRHQKTQNKRTLFIKQCINQFLV